MSQKQKRKNRKQQDNRRSCPHCSSGAETFRYMDSIFLFDVDLAREIVSDGREPIELEPDDVRYSVDTSRIYEQHLDHVNPKYPGIIAHIWYPEPDGNVLHGHVLVDGHHRAARCLRDELPYYVHILSEEESRTILLKAPDIDAILASLECDSPEAVATA
ncbi:hypothetical protein GC176_09550 [bacterium]|nr:hypothetical protein [bacterium]